MSEPNLTTRNTTTRKEAVKYVDVVSNVGIKVTYALYLDAGDSLRENEFLLQVNMVARPEAPQLQRPLAERITIYKVNVFYHSVIESTADVEILDTPSVIV